jgi:hypothetical protein
MIGIIQMGSSGYWAYLMAFLICACFAALHIKKSSESEIEDRPKRVFSNVFVQYALSISS